MRKLYWNNDAFKSSTDFDHIKTHYYWSHTQVSRHSSLYYQRMLRYLFCADQPVQDCTRGSDSFDPAFVIFPLAESMFTVQRLDYNYVTTVGLSVYVNE